MNIYKIDHSRMSEVTVTPIEFGGTHGWECSIALKGRELVHGFYGPTKKQALKQFLSMYRIMIHHDRTGVTLAP